MEARLGEQPIIQGFPYYVVPGLILIMHQLAYSNDFFKAAHLWEVGASSRSYNRAKTDCQGN